MTEIINHLVTLVVDEFNTVMRGYKFNDYKYLELVNNNSGTNIIIPPHELKLIQMDKLNIDTFLTPSK